MGGNGDAKPVIAPLVMPEGTPAQLHACEMVAAFCPATEILAECRGLAGGDKLNVRWLYSLASTVQRPKKWAGLIDSLRADIPVLDAAYRMRKRQQIVEVGIKSGELKEARETLNDVERLVGIVPAGRSAGPTTAIQVNVGDLNRKPADGGQMAAWHETMLAELDDKCPGNGDGQGPETDAE